jgi:hypothetical protein
MGTGTGMFQGGKLSESTELTPLPRGVEVGYHDGRTAQPYPAELIARIRKRTHSPQGERQ